MYKEFGKTKNWKRILFPSIFLIGFFSIPTSAFFLYTAMKGISLQSFFFLLFFVICGFFFPLKHLRNLYIFPPIQLDDNFIVVNQPFQNRCVYTLKQISNVKVFLKSVIFLHNSFPVLLNLNSLDESERIYIVERLKLANKDGS